MKRSKIVEAKRMLKRAEQAGLVGAAEIWREILAYRKMQK
jgi:hypothetical protein